MKSMTGFGQGAAAGAAVRVSVTVSSVNHRHLDLVLRTPEELRPQDGRLRERISARVRRGRCEVAVAVRRLVEPPVAIELRREAVVALVAACRPLVEDGLIRSELTIGDLVRASGLVAIERDASSWDAAEDAVLDAALDAALDQLDGARVFEGARLASALSSILESLDGISATLRTRLPQVRAELEAALRGRLKEWARGEGLPEDRLLQEVATLVERIDVQEELDRFDAHLEQVTAVLQESAAVGRRLDFLAQELARELNTLSAKCRQPEIVRLALDAKLLCEQFREQVQNVE